MNPIELLEESGQHELRSERVYGAVIGVVTNTKDPDGLGRIKVKFPWLSEVDESPWARLAVPMAGKECGTYFPPEIGDEVLVVFEHGDVGSPYVIGALWNYQDRPPVPKRDGMNNIRVIKSRSGHVVRLNDDDQKSAIEIIDSSEKNKIVIDTSQNSITVTSASDITLSAPQGTIKLDAKTVQINSTAASKFEVGAAMNMEASGTMTIKGKTVNIN